MELDGFSNESVASENELNDFMNYYQRRLTEEGWKLTDAVSGPSGGDRRFYEKSGYYITFGFWPGDPLYNVFIQHN